MGIKTNRTSWSLRGNIVLIYTINVFMMRVCVSGANSGRAHPLKLEKNMIFWLKIVIFFTRYTPKFFAPPSARRNCFKCAPPNLKSWIRPCYWYESQQTWLYNTPTFTKIMRRDRFQIILRKNMRQHEI